MVEDPNLWQANTTPKLVNNPLDHDFIDTYRDDKNAEHTITIPALDAIKLPTWLADVTGHHLITAIMNEREMGLVTPEGRQKLEEEVFV